MAILLRAKNRDPYTLAQTTSCLQHCSARGVILSKPSYICYFCLNITVLQFSLAPYAIRITYTKKNKIKYLCIEQVNLINLISALDFIDVFRERSTRRNNFNCSWVSLFKTILDKNANTAQVERVYLVKLIVQGRDVSVHTQTIIKALLIGEKI